MAYWSRLGQLFRIEVFLGDVDGVRLTNGANLGTKVRRKPCRRRQIFLLFPDARMKVALVEKFIAIKCFLPAVLAAVVQSTAQRRAEITFRPWILLVCLAFSKSQNVI